jgi:two-component system, NarL family, nitrate/nitrite response regulator NarL
MSANPISILLADDHQLVIDGITSMLASEKHFVIAGAAGNGQAALELIENDPEKFQLLITDISMSQLNGIELCKAVKSRFPSVRVLILSMYSSATVVKEALAAEADGYILKSTGKDEFLAALHRIIDGGTYFGQDILPIIYNQYQKEKKQDEALAVLSAREKEILALIVKENTSEEIAEQLHISKKTVDNHRKNILSKTGCRSTVGLVKYAIRNGIE